MSPALAGKFFTIELLEKAWWKFSMLYFSKSANTNIQYKWWWFSH